MSKLTDRSHLLSDQYRNDSNLTARVQLHERFSTNQYGWQKWVFDQLSIPPDSRILELGCGPAWFWAENIDRIPSSWEVVLTDFSPGMIASARVKLADWGKRFKFGIVDAQALPFECDSFDAVMANHMLYHVPEREQAIVEIRRVLVDGGSFYTATNGQTHMQEIRTLTAWAKQNLGSAAEKAFQTEGNPFTLENGGEQLQPYFQELQMRRYEDAFQVTEVQPLLSFIMSMVGHSEDALGADQLERLKDHLESRMEEEGAIMISKDSGLFLAR